MKWIGQHIWDFITRFRNEVYLEDISAGTPNAFISVDSSKKIVTGGKDATTTVSGIVELATTAETTTGTPKYYAMSDGGATGAGATTSGKITIVPTPSSGFMYKLHYNARPLGLSSANTTTFLSLNFGNGLLYACLLDAFSYLKGPMDMLQLYEQKYQTEVQKFGAEQIGRRRRDDYTDGEPRIPVPQQTP